MLLPDKPQKPMAWKWVALVWRAVRFTRISPQYEAGWTLLLFWLRSNWRRCWSDSEAIRYRAEEAAVKLAEDFGLNYDSRQKPSIRPRIREPTPEQKYQKGENHCYKVLTDYFHLLREWEKKYAPKQPDEEWNPLFAEALYKKNYIEYLLDILLYGSLEERKALVAEQRKEVLKLEQRIAELSADRTMHSRRNPKQLRAERER